MTRANMTFQFFPNANPINILETSTKKAGGQSESRVSPLFFFAYLIRDFNASGGESVNCYDGVGNDIWCA